MHARIPEYAKIDEIPFDFQRRIMSVVVRTPEGKDRIISKGAPEAIFAHCQNFELDGELFSMDHLLIEELKEEYDQLSGDGFRVLAIASKDIEPRGSVAGDSTPYSKEDERDLILNGYVAFLDPPKESAMEAIKALQGAWRGGQDRHGRQRSGRAQDLPGSRTVHRTRVVGK